MVACGVCGTSDQFLFQCQHCKGQYCQDHRGSEDHHCGADPPEERVFSSPETRTSTDRPEAVRQDSGFALPEFSLPDIALPDFGSIRQRSDGFLDRLPKSRTLFILAVLFLSFGLIFGSVAVYGPTIRDALSDGPLGPTSGDSSVVPAEELNETSVERMVAAEVNEFRTRQPTGGVDYATGLAEIARYHSRDMANRNYTGHVGPDGETVADRFDRFDYECDSPNELILFTQYDQPFETSNGTMRFTNESELATGIVELWLRSSPHREALLSESWDSIGVGVHLTDENRVYVTLNAC